MRNFDKVRTCGDATPQKWLAKVTMGGAYSLLIALLGVACSREPDDVYQDPPYADPNVRVGQNAFEQVEPADQHDGAVFGSYEFKGKGPAIRWRTLGSMLPMVLSEIET